MEIEQPDRRSPGLDFSADTDTSRRYAKARMIVDRSIRRWLTVRGAWHLLTARLLLLWFVTLIASILALCALAIVLEPHVVDVLLAMQPGISGAEKLIFSALIYLIVYSLGMYRLAAAVGHLSWEQDALRQFAKQLEETFTDLQDVTPGRILHTPIEELFATAEDARLRGLEATSTFKLAQIIRLDASEHRFDPVSMSVEQIGGQVLDGSMQLRDTQQLSVRLGILATFIGIMFSLQGVSALMTHDKLTEEALREAIKTVVTSLGFAFTSSIAGLAAAILFQVASGLLRARETDALLQLQALGSDYQSICRKAIDAADIAKFATYSERMVDAAKTTDESVSRIGRSARLIEDGLDAPITSLREATDQLRATVGSHRDALASLSGATAALTEFGPTLATMQREAHERLLAALTEMADRLVREFRAGYDADAARRMEAAAERQYALVAATAKAFQRAAIILGTMFVITVLVATGWGERLFVFAVTLLQKW